jgi:anthranilate phosphoribosyltransferase
MLKQAIEKLIRREDLSSETCQQLLEEILTGQANTAQQAAFLVLLRAKGETAEEIAGMVASLKAHMIPVHTTHTVTDLVGTGGDCAGTVNISTGSAILAASCGLKVAKHGNRAVSSLAGSADVLEALHININLTPEQVSQSIEDIGIGFCFAPNFHPALLSLRTIRKELNVPTVFNLLGPLLNPTNPAHLVLGVFDESLLDLVAGALQQMGTQKSLVIHGAGLDELSTLGPSKIIEVTPHGMKTMILDPQQLGFKTCTLADLKGADAATNAALLLKTFQGHKGAIADALILNAAAALYINGMHPSIQQAIEQAKEALFDGSALNLLKKWEAFSYVQ